jgi:hypothetical protein
VSDLQREDVCDPPGQVGDASRGGTGQEASARQGLSAGTSRNAHQRGSSRLGYQLVLGGHLAGERLEHPDLRPRHGDQHRAADEPVRYGVAGRREPHAREFVDLAAGRRPISGRSDGSMPSSGRCSSRCADTAQISECTAALTSAPAGRRLVRRRRVADDGPSRHHQVTLGMADQVLHDPLRLGSAARQKSGRSP